MRLRFGRYAGQTTETLVLRKPDYVVWMLREAPDGVAGRAFTTLIDRFDNAPVVGKCEACGAEAVRAFGLPFQSSLVRLCPACTPTADNGGLVPIEGFWDAHAHVDATFVRGRRLGLRRVVRELARAKGASRRLTEAAALRFFKVDPAAVDHAPGVGRRRGQAEKPLARR